MPRKKLVSDPSPPESDGRPSSEPKEAQKQTEKPKKVTSRRKSEPAPQLFAESAEALSTPELEAVTENKAPSEIEAAREIEAPELEATPVTDVVPSKPARPLRKRAGTAKSLDEVAASPVVVAETSPEPTPSRTKGKKVPPINKITPAISAEPASGNEASLPPPVQPPEAIEAKTANSIADVEPPISAPSQVEAEAVAKPPAKTKKTAKKKKAPPKQPELLDPDGVLTISFRPRTATVVPIEIEPQGETLISVGAEAAPEIAVKPVTEARERTAPLSIDGEMLAILEWRTPGNRPIEQLAEQTAEGDQTLTEQALAPEQAETGRFRKRRRGGNRDRQEAAAPAASPLVETEIETEAEAPTPAPVTQTVPEPVPVEIPKKPSIIIPETAPQIVVRDGVLALVRNHRVYPPLIFFGNPSDERRSETVFEELKMAADAGVHLHSFLVPLVIDESNADAAAAFAAYLLHRAVEIDPEAQVIFRIDFQASRGWERIYPKAAYYSSHRELAEPSVCDDEFWGAAQNRFELFVKKLRLLDKADHVLGVHIERGEWFMSAGHGFDTSPAAVKSFREWAKQRYANDVVTLRASWFDGGVNFDTIQIPEFSPEGEEGEKFIRSSRKQRRWVDYHLFLSDVTVSRIGELAYAAKAASGGMLLIGVSYGYTFEWSHPASGHLSLGKLLRSPEIDFLAGPPSYRDRQPGGTAPFPGPIDSFALNGKLYISEEDFKTSLSKGHEPDDFNPALKTPQALESVHWRGVGTALAHGSGMSWMDVWGNGWLRTHSVWERATRVLDALVDRMEAPLGDPEVAVFIDERALAYLVDSNAFDLLVRNVRESVLRAGVSAAFYLLSDLAHREKFPESKLYLFLNAWDIRPDLRASIKSRLQKDGKVLFWLYSAGLFDAGRESLERAREVTGIALKPQPFHSQAGTTILNRRHPLAEAFPNKSLVSGAKLEPSYFAIPEDGLVLGEYTQTGLPSFVVKEFRDDPAARWTSVFLGEPLVNPGLIRALAQMAGAHVWNFHEDVVHVRGPFCTIHCTGTGPRTIALPSRSCAYNLLTADWVAMDATNVRFVGIDGSTHVFLIGEKSEIEHFLRADPSDVLKIENLPPRELNVRIDHSNFDVPIMKLDEWIEGGDQDEVADEWFLRPQAMLDEHELVPAQAEESPEEVGKRRRRRKRGRGGDGEPGPLGRVVTATVDTGGSSDDEPFSMNVVFRKRE